MKRAPALLSWVALLGLGGCATPAIQHADDVLERRVSQLEDSGKAIVAEARVAAQAAVADVDARVAARIGDVQAAATTLRAEALRDVDVRLTAQREDLAKEIDRQRTETLAALPAVVAASTKAALDVVADRLANASIASPTPGPKAEKGTPGEPQESWWVPLATGLGAVALAQLLRWVDHRSQEKGAAKEKARKAADDGASA